MGFNFQRQSCLFMIAAPNRTMVSLPRMLTPLPRTLVGGILLSATATVYAAGGSWTAGAWGCSTASPGSYYNGVCKETNEDATGAKVVFDAATGPGTAIRVVGGFSDSGNASNNTVTVSSGEPDNVYGGYSGSYSSAAKVLGNTVMMSGGSVMGSVYGGYGFAAQVSGNTVTVSGGLVKPNSGGVYGGFSSDGNVTGNGVTVSGEASINQNVYGGYSEWANATDNTVTVSGGLVTRNVYGGYAARRGNAIGNRVILMGSPVFGSSTVIYGGDKRNGAGEVVHGNILEVHTKSLAASNVKNFQQYSFLLPPDTQAGDTVLTLTDTAGTNLTDAQVGVMMQSGGHLLKKGDKVALIHNSAGVNSTGVKQVSLSGYQGISLEYTFGLGSDANNLYAITESAPQVRQQAKAPIEGVASSMAFSLQGADLVAGLGMDNAVGASGAGSAGGSGNVNAFGAMSGSNSRYHSGSHVDVNGSSLMLGAAKQLPMGLGKLTVGVFFEGGWSSYDTYNDFDGGDVRGSGRADYVGGGVLAQRDWASGLYAQASVRGGRIRSDWSSADMGIADASFDTSTPYYGAHVGVGMVLPLTIRTAVDVSAKYFWSRQNSEDVEIAGDPYHFEAVHSQRTRLGARVTHAFTEQITGYVGAAWDREYDGVARATVYGLDTPSPSLKGDTGVFEIGVSLKPDAASPLTVALGVESYVGQREGVGGTLRMGWVF